MDKTVARLKMGISVLEMSKMLKVSETKLMRYENSNNDTGLSLEQQKKYAEILNVPKRVKLVTDLEERILFKHENWHKKYPCNTTRVRRLHYAIVKRGINYRNIAKDLGMNTIDVLDVFRKYTPNSEVVKLIEDYVYAQPEDPELFHIDYEGEWI